MLRLNAHPFFRVRIGELRNERGFALIRISQRIHPQIKLVPALIVKQGKLLLADIAIPRHYARDAQFNETAALPCLFQRG